MRKLKSLYLPAAIVLMGVGAAFATNNAKSSDDAPEPGYLFDSSTSECMEKRSDCSPTGTVFCTWEDANNQSHSLSRLSGTSCIQPLYEP
ncbi:DUF6520 family protein [Sunxiuqinia dokdonensis]|uniref:DUF6520 family protein n=1 Tax=Sunxiuqinia dokdonensis TaxID=1409788 RepID=UPI00069F9CAE|nr:DUF6520 family protein [Sunxiuqinia dokdonensis]